MPIERRAWITKEMMRAEPNALFVFGDNLERWGRGGQAKEMRGEPNAVGLPTKRSPYTFLTDDDFIDLMAAVAKDVAKLQQHLLAGRTVVWPKDGIGTGRAALVEHAPGIAQWYAGLYEGLCALSNSCLFQIGKPG